MATAKVGPQLVYVEPGVDLAEKTMLLVAGFSKLGNTKRLKDSQFQHEGDPAMVKAQKKLLASPELREVGKLDGQLREFFRLEALPFPQPSTYLIPKEQVTVVVDRITSFKKKRQRLIDKFVDSYPERKEEAEKRLGPLFNERDYPSVQEVKEAFNFWHLFTNYGTPDSLRTINESIWLDEKAKAAAQMTNAVDEIMAVRRELLLKMVNHLAEKLGEENGKQKIFRDTTVEKLQDFLDKFEKMNVVNDDEASRLVKKARILLSGKSADELRTTEGVRETVKKGMEKIAAELTTLVEDRPSRKMRGF